MKLYHYTSHWKASEIIRRGLEARDPQFLSQPVGAYLTTDDRWGWFGDVVLEIDGAGLPLQPDPYYEDRTSVPNTAFVIPGAPYEIVVPPERIKVFRDENKIAR